MNFTHYIPHFIIAAIGGAVSLIVWLIQKDKLRLNYFITETESFDAYNVYLKFYTINLVNSGNKMIQSINVSVSFSEGKIDRITNDRLIKELNQSDTDLSFSIERLNPKDSLSFTITIQETKKGAAKPVIAISGNGATALDKTSSQSKSAKSSELFVSGIFAGVVIFLLLDFVFVPTSESPKLDRIENVFSILNKARLPQLFTQIIESHDDLSYAGTAFYLTHAYLKDTANRDSYISALKMFSQVEDISSNSKGVIYYLLYKIYKREKEPAESEEYSRKCKTEVPLIYEQMMAQDQYYDLDSLRKFY